MDPNAALAALRDIVDDYDREHHGTMNGAEWDAYCRYQLFRMVEQFDALDSWLIQGGFKPKDWSK